MSTPMAFLSNSADDKMIGELDNMLHNRDEFLKLRKLEHQNGIVRKTNVKSSN